MTVGPIFACSEQSPTSFLIHLSFSLSIIPFDATVTRCSMTFTVRTSIFCPGLYSFTLFLLSSLRSCCFLKRQGHTSIPAVSLVKSWRDKAREKDCLPPSTVSSLLLFKENTKPSGALNVHTSVCQFHLCY